MKTAAPPAPPDPVATARAQSQTNRETATTQQQLNMVDQTNPYGSQRYTQTGTWADGTPRFSMETTLSDPEQRNQNQQWEFDNLTNQLGINQTKKLTGLLDTPFKLGNEESEGRLFELGRKRLDPLMQQRTEALETKLYNQGVMPGTEAYRRAMEANTQGSNDAYNQLLLSGRGQANQELMAERNQPINEITALMSGGQVNQPQFGNTPQTSVAGTDLAGLTMDAYKYGPLAQWQAQQANKQAMMSGLFGIGGAALGGWARGGFAKPGFMS
jgi:hypothetical protein